MKVTPLLVFHSVAALQFLYGCYYDYAYVIIPGYTQKQNFGGKFKYLTYLNAIIQTLYYSVAALNDIIGSNNPTLTPRPPIRKLKDLMYCTLAFPLAIFVSSTFWAIYAVDRELIFPRMLDPYFPGWLNHVMHTNISLCILIELYTTFRKYPKKERGLKILTIFLLCYAVWIHIVYVRSERWVYPILAVITWPVRFLFYLGALILAMAFYTLGEVLNEKVWSAQLNAIALQSRKKSQ